MIKISKVRENFFRFGLIASGFFAAAAMSVWAATTISTNLSTGGTLEVTGLSTIAGANLSGVFNASSTAHVSGNTILSTLTASGLSTLAGVNASGVVNASSTAHVDGVVMFKSPLYVGTSSTDNTRNLGMEGNALITGRLRVGGITSTSTVKVGSSGTAITQILFSGTCTVNPPALQAMGGTPAGDSAIGDTSHASCVDATGVTTSDRVFISGPPAGWINDVVIVNASSTGVDTINFVFKNTSTTTANNIGSLSIPWFAIQ